MSCKFSFPVTMSPDEVFSRASTAIQKGGGTIDGSGAGGTFSLPTPIGKIAGSFTIDNSIMNVIIIDKPLLVSCSVIEQRLRGFINESA